MDKTLSSAMEDYLKTIYHIAEDNEVVTTLAVANHLGVSAPSATAMIKKLASLHLAEHTPYRGVELTPSGQKIALQIIRHHRLIETYLSEALGVEWDKVHEEADRWEHVLSEEVEAKMAALLGHPTHDPHGAPIPTLEGEVPERAGLPLSATSAGSLVTVRRVSDENAELLRHLRDIGLTPKAKVEVLRAVPAEGVLQLRVDGREQTIGMAPAAAVIVELVKEAVVQ